MFGLMCAVHPLPVMAALEAAIHADARTSTAEVWMAGSSPAMTKNTIQVESA